MPSKPLEPGEPVRLGRFELLGRLGEGGQGVVYLGRGTNPGEERVAVKVLRSTVDVMHRIMYEEPDVSGLPPSLRSVVLECLDKDPARRPSARDLLLRLVDPTASRPAAAGPAAPAGDLVDSVPNTGPLYPPPGPTFPGRQPTELSRPGLYGPGLSVPGPAPARSRRTPILAVGGAVAAAIVVLAVVLLTRGSPPASPAGSGDNSLTGSTSSPAAAAPQTMSPPPATTGATIPAAFAGTWKGKATMGQADHPPELLERRPAAPVIDQVGHVLGQHELKAVRGGHRVGRPNGLLEFIEQHRQVPHQASVTGPAPVSVMYEPAVRDGHRHARGNEPCLGRAAAPGVRGHRPARARLRAALR